MKKLKWLRLGLAALGVALAVRSLIRRFQELSEEE